MSSSGLHSNGFSLVRKLVEHAGLKVTDHVAALGKTVGDELLTPTLIYVKPIKHLLKHYPVKKNVIRGLAHITGGGLVDNVPRILPPGTRAFIKRGSWPIPPVFPWLQELGSVEQAEMDRVFNGGIGFVVIAAPFYAESIRERLTRDGFPTHHLGEIKEGEPGVEWM
jgi:phosphoribosylformylglycinamidine cyclo-ligase